MTNETGIQRAEPILETYDPNWKARRDKTGLELDQIQIRISGAYRSDNIDEVDTLLPRREKP